MTTTFADPDAAAPPRPAGFEAQRKSHRRRQLAERVGLPLLFLAIILAAWWSAAEYGGVSQLLLPPPSEVLEALNRGIIGGLWWKHIAITMYEMVAGFAIGASAGLVLGALFAFVAPLYKAAYPFIIALQSFPKIAIAPLLVVALGYGAAPKIVVAALLAYFPVMTAAIAGFTNLDPGEHNLMRSVGASKWQEMRFLRLPNAMSYIFPSLDVAIVLALLGAVAAELVGAQSGLGYLLVERQGYGDSAAMFAALILLALVGITLRSAVQLLRRLLPRSIAPPAANG
jgi:NitT/TauT family transport system permease protein